MTVLSILKYLFIWVLIMGPLTPKGSFCWQRTERKRGVFLPNVWTKVIFVPRISTRMEEMTNFSLAVIPSQGIIIILLSLTLGKFQVPYNNRKLQAKLYPASSEGSVWTCDCLLSTLSVRSDSQENNTVKCQDQHFSLSLSLFPSLLVRVQFCQVLICAAASWLLENLKWAKKSSIILVV